MVCAHEGHTASGRAAGAARPSPGWERPLPSGMPYGCAALRDLLCRRVGLCCSLLFPRRGEARIAAVSCVAGATGRAARPGSRSPARPLLVGAVASLATARLLHGGWAGALPRRRRPKESKSAASVSEHRKRTSRARGGGGGGCDGRRRRTARGDKEPRAGDGDRGRGLGALNASSSLILIPRSVRGGERHDYL